MTFRKFSTFAFLIAAALSCKSRQESSEEKDLGKHDGYTVYKWPKNIRKRNYEDLATQMTQFSETVGTCLNRSPKGAAEDAWLGYDRYARNNALKATTSSAKNWCNAVKELLLSYSPTTTKYNRKRSDYCQYANCGEGAKIAACLAYDYGFRGDEIQVCTGDDHGFVLIPDQQKKDFCILDRWPRLGVFRCGINLLPDDDTLTVDGVPTKDAWFKGTTCVTLKEYLKDPEF